MHFKFFTNLINRLRILVHIHIITNTIQERISFIQCEMITVLLWTV